jgi:RNA polymerase sigma factor (sigma-70 family)
MIDLSSFFLKNQGRHLKMIGKVLYKDPSTVEDVVQEAYLRAHKYRGSYDSERSGINTWFNSILYNTLRDFQKSYRSQPGFSEDTEEQADVIEFNKISEHLNLIEKELSKVKKPKRQQVLYLYYILGYSSKEISEIVSDMTVTNVTTICNRFKNDLKQRYNIEV